LGRKHRTQIEEKRTDGDSSIFIGSFLFDLGSILFVMPPRQTLTAFSLQNMITPDKVQT
jgi:hypothetical protein